MLQTSDLILDKAKFSDWEGMYRNVWSSPESARYMQWRVTTSESDARIRIQKTIDFQKTHDTWLVYEKATGEPIGFAGVERAGPDSYQEMGICLGPRYVGRGFGGQILDCLIAYCRAQGAKEFLYSAREENMASHRLAESRGFKRVSSAPGSDLRDGHPYRLICYRLRLDHPEEGESGDV